LKEKAMRLLKPDEDYEGEDSGDCPHCRAELVEFAEDVSGADYQDGERDVAAVKCPKCDLSIAVMRLHSYRLLRFKQK
jgi:ssDNA-binding Zn-finger/Zn-ribbon topoisomerase 1